MGWRFLFLSVEIFGQRINVRTFAPVVPTCPCKGRKLKIAKKMNVSVSKKAMLLAYMLVFFSSCERLDNDPNEHVADANPSYVSLQEVVEIMTLLPIAPEQLSEVHSAVSASSGNGYDEEYTMVNLFALPGAGVGDQVLRSSVKYAAPMRDLISDVVKELVSEDSMAKSANADLNVSRTLERLGADAFLEALSKSDMQIYWPFSEEWDGVTMPIITYDPEDGSDTNIGYRLFIDDDGFHHVEEVLVDEAMAEEVPVWVINRNDDAEFTTLEMLRREDPEWGEGGGNIIVKPEKSPLAKAGKGGIRSLLLRELTMKRNYDTWFAGASEFFVKIGSVEDFTASTEAELRLYSPSVTDFMIVVKRNQVGKPQAFNAMLISDLSEQLTHCAFLITEDDGGTITKWDCQALVRVASKSYGIEISIPFNSRDDIVWRGQLAMSWFENNNNVTGHFGDVDLVFEILD